MAARCAGASYGGTEESSFEAAPRRPKWCPLPFSGRECVAKGARSQSSSEGKPFRERTVTGHETEEETTACERERRWYLLRGLWIWWVAVLSGSGSRFRGGGCGGGGRWWSGESEREDCEIVAEKFSGGVNCKISPTIFVSIGRYTDRRPTTKLFLLPARSAARQQLFLLPELLTVPAAAVLLLLPLQSRNVKVGQAISRVQIIQI